MPRALAMLSLLALAGATPLAAGEPPLELRLMTYNLRYASAEPPHAWAERRPQMRALLEREAPDIFGTQEGLYAQLRDIAADLPAYEWIGLGRAGGSRDEHCAIFFRRDRFEPLEFDHFWLSDTPEVVGSITWGPKFRRMVTWVKFRDRASGRAFLVWNTHFDHEVEEARRKSAWLIRDRLARTDPGLPVVLLGDFNCVSGASAAHETLTRGTGLTDTWTLAAHRANADVNSFNGFTPATRRGERIDWILVRGASEVSSAAVVVYDEGKSYPSDHFPVTAVVKF